MKTYTQKTLCVLALLIIALNLPSVVYAQSCPATFSDGLGSSTASGSIVFQGNARVLSSPDNILDTTSITYGTGTSCFSVQCTKSDTPVTGMTYSGTFATGLPAINVPASQSAAFPPGNYSSITVGHDALLTLDSGLYVISGDIVLADQSEITNSASGTIGFIAQGSLTMGRLSNINGNGTNTTFFSYIEGSVFADDNSGYLGMLYSKGNVEIYNVLGASVVSESTITLTNLAAYSSARASDTDTFGLCGTGSGSPTLTITSITVAASSSTPSACSPVEITLSILDQNGDVITDYTGTITLSTPDGSGDWSKTSTAADALGVLTPGAANSGAATYVFDATDNGVITLDFSSTRAQTVDFNAQDSSAGVSQTLEDIVFADNEFNFVDAGGFSDDVIAGRGHTFTVQMVKIDEGGTNTSCGVATDYNVDNVEVWFSRVAGDPGTSTPVLEDDDSVQLSLPQTQPVSTNFSANFVNGEATVTLITTDVGQYTLHMADNSDTYADVQIMGSSNTLTARPFGFSVSVTGNPAATDHSGTVFVKAGEAFGVSVQAVGWSSADDANNDGIPDGHNDTDPSNNANLANNMALVSFGLESTPESITLSAYEVDPGVTIGVLDSSTSPADGRVITSLVNGAGSTSTVRYGNVGIIELQAAITDGAYLNASAGETTAAVSGSGNTGRFIPSLFYADSITVSDPGVCSAYGFAYLWDDGEIVTVTLHARNQQGAITTNYTDDYAKLVETSDIDQGWLDTPDNIDVTSPLSNGSVPNYLAAGWSNGVLNANVLIRGNRIDGVTPHGPYRDVKIGITATDTDGVTLSLSQLDLDLDGDSNNDHIEISEQNFLYGRIRIDNAFGPETVDLDASIYFEYWNGGGWQLNVDDSCSGFQTWDIYYSGIAGDADSRATYEENRTFAIGGGTTTAMYPNYVVGSPYISRSYIEVINGVATQYFTAPGEGNTGSFDVRYEYPSNWFLGWDWDNDGFEPNTGNGHPSVRYEFGSYRGHDRVLNWQEVLDP